MILKKELKAHEKLQPIRKLSEFIGVNNTTVVKAYELLENEGYIYKVIGSGTFVSSCLLYTSCLIEGMPNKY